jgi:hypothetical protein
LYARENNDSKREIIPFEESDGVTDVGIQIAHQSGWQPVMNKSGRQSLGCMLKTSGMPTLCASYPVAPELSQVDFWHVRRVFWRKSRSVSDHLSLGHSPTNDFNSSQGEKQRMASGWQREENYVILRNHNCEGFEALESTAEEVAYDGDKQDSLILPTIKSYLTASSDNNGLEDEESTIERWEESQWFFAFVEDISGFFPTEQIHSKSIQLIFLNRLALIWYNFDSLSTSNSRPIKSYRRLKRDIEALTWVLVKETKRFVELLQTEEGDEESQSQSYLELLARWKIN